MKDIANFNEIVSDKIRRRLNRQKNRIKHEAVCDHNGKIIEPFIYVMGLGEIHYRTFQDEIVRICSDFPWTQKKHIRFILSELVVNTQFSMLRQVLRKVESGEKIAAFFYIVIYACEDFFSASIQEFGDYFDYYAYLENAERIKYDEKKEDVYTGLANLVDEKIKLILTSESDLIVADGSNKIALEVIERATDQDFHVTSFYKDGQYMWKRIYFRVENSGLDD